MQKQIVLTEEEYNDLLKKSKAVVDDDHVVISKSLLQEYEAINYTAFSFLAIKRLCPNCKSAYLVRGYVCPCCNHDDSGHEDDDDE